MLLIVCGVRPQYIKAAALCYELAEKETQIGKAISRLVIDTGQHYSHEVAADIQRDIGLRPDVIMAHANYSPEYLLGDTLAQLDLTVPKNAGALHVVVFGDATPALAGALFAKMRGAFLTHIEAGERRHPAEMEDFNSRVVDQVADLALCVTQRAVNTLRTEGFRGKAILSGDMASRWYKQFLHGVQVETLSDYILVTVHRPQNVTRARLQLLADVISETGAKAVWVSHPRTQTLLQSIRMTSAIELRPPAKFSEFASLLHGCKGVISDSGGVVREALQIGRRAVVCRAAGAWPSSRSDVWRCPDWNRPSLELGLAWLRQAPRDAAQKDSTFGVVDGIESGVRAIIEAIDLSPSVL